jgi:hypothetical protein
VLSISTAPRATTTWANSEPYRTIALVLKRSYSTGMDILRKEIWAGGCRQESSDIRVIPIGTKSLRLVLADAYFFYTENC